MRAIHDQFTHEICAGLKTTCIGLGLVRLLQDAKRFDEARAILYALENGIQGAAEKPQKRCDVKEMNGVARIGSTSSELAANRINAPEAPTQPVSIA